LPNLNAELEDFAMDPGSAPPVARNNWRISSGTWSAAATSRLPSPERTKTGTMPPDNRLPGSTITKAFTTRGAIQLKAAKTRRSKLLRASRFGAFLRSTLSRWRSVRISASS
jgi:hypothetical protein